MRKTFKDLRVRQMEEKLERVSAFRDVSTPGTGWIKSIRTALGMPQSYLSRKLGVSQPTVAAYEQSEADETIQIATLKKVADAMECDFVYAFVPRGSLHRIRYSHAQNAAQRIVGAVDQTMALEDQAVPKRQLATRVDQLANELLTEHPKAIWDE